jgi:4-amino-4-deoxy-L-arabinose transferase
MERSRSVVGVGAAIAMLLAGYLAVYLVNLDTRPLARMDEFRYAEIAREMLATSNWVSPRLNGLRYFEKPALGHWVEAATIAAFGENNFASRLPSALATGATALFIGLLAFRLTRNGATATLAAFIHLTFLAVFGIGTINILDPQLTLWLTLTIGGYLWAWLEPGTYQRRALKILAGVACGLALLTKGFLALVVPVIVITPFLAWEKQWRELFRGLWLPFAVAVLVALPWSLLIHLQEPDFWRYFFWEEHIRRFAADNAQHSKPAWLFLAAFPAMALPWTFALPAAIRGLRQGPGDRAVLRFLALWLIAPFLFFSAARGKLLTYILPCFPPLAILLAVGLSRLTGDEHAARLRSGLTWLTGCWAVLLLALLLNHLAGVGKPFFDATESARWGALAGALVAGIAVCVLALRAGRGQWQLLATGLAVLPLLLTIPFAIPNSIRLSKMPGAELATLTADLPPDALLISDGAYVHAVAWTAKRDDIYLLSAGELKYGLSYPEDRHRLLNPETLQALLAASIGQREILIACDVDREPVVTAALDQAARTVKVSRTGYGEMVAWRIPGDLGQ